MGLISGRKPSVDDPKDQPPKDIGRKMQNRYILENPISPASTRAGAPHLRSKHHMHTAPSKDTRVWPEGKE